MKLINSKITLYKQIEKRTRYYSLKIYPTLFQEYVFVREYGNLKNKKPTRIINKHFCSFNDAMNELEILYKQRIKRGYKINIA